MDGGIFERSGLGESFREDSCIAENDEFDALNKTNVLKVISEAAAAEGIRPHYAELLPAPLRLDVRNLIYSIINALETSIC